MVPKDLDNRRAVSTVMDRVPWTISLIRRAVQGDLLQGDIG